MSEFSKNAVKYVIKEFKPRKQEKFKTERNKRIEKYSKIREENPEYRLGTVSRSALTDVDYCKFTNQDRYQYCVSDDGKLEWYETRTRVIPSASSEDPSFLTKRFGDRATMDKRVDRLLDPINLNELKYNSDNELFYYHDHVANSVCAFSYSDLKAKIKPTPNGLKIIGDPVIKMGLVFSDLVMDVGYGIWVFSSIKMEQTEYEYQKNRPCRTTPFSHPEFLVEHYFPYANPTAKKLTGWNCTQSYAYP